MGVDGSPASAPLGFPAGLDAAARLRWSRQRLLDLTLRNRLLNFPSGAPDFKERDRRVYKHLPLVADVGAVWRRLVLEDEKQKPLHVQTLPEGDDAAREIAEVKEAGDLCACVDDEHLGKRLLKLHYEQKTLESSTGDSAFFLALGFLEWYEAPPKQVKPLFAPLLLLHVRLDKTRPKPGGPIVFGLTMDADEPFDNTCLREKLKSEHDLILPSAEKVESPDDYLRSVQNTVKGKKTWRVHLTAALGFFNFARYRLWLDLDAKQWEGAIPPAEHPVVRGLLDQKWPGAAHALPHACEIAEHQEREDADLPIVLDADSTQYGALMAALRGQSLVVIGPPGSGKSQTIANLIAVAMAHGKRVLFVAQKLAALQVVQRRIQEVGLAQFCLFFDPKNSKPAEIHRQLRLAREIDNPGGREHGSSSARLAHKLNQVALRLGKNGSKSSAHVSHVIQRACVARVRAREAWGKHWNERLLRIELPAGFVTPSWMEERERALCECARLRAEAGSAWTDWSPVKLFAMDVPLLEVELRAAADAAARAGPQLGTLPDSMRALPIPSLKSLLDLAMETPLPTDLVPTLLRFVWRAGREGRPVHELERALEDFHRQRQRAVGILRDLDGNPGERAESIRGAAARLCDGLDPSTLLSAVDPSLRELATCRDEALDLLSQSVPFAAGIALLNAGGAGELTWGTIDRASRQRPTSDTQVRPPLLALAAYLAGEPRRLADLPLLTKRLDCVHEIEQRADELLPSLSRQPGGDRPRLREAVGALQTVGFGSVPLGSLSKVRDAVTDLRKRIDALLVSHGLPNGAMRALTVDVTPATCRGLATCVGTCKPEVMTPPAGVMQRVVESLAAGAVSFADLSNWLAVLETARNRQSSARKILPKIGLGDHSAPPLPAASRTWLDQACSVAGRDQRVGDVRTLEKLARDTDQMIGKVSGNLRQLARFLKMAEPATLGEAHRFARLAGILRKLPPLPKGTLVDRLSSVADVERLRKAVQACAALRARESSLAKRVALGDLPTRDDVVSLRCRLRSHQGSWLRWLSGDYRQARRKVREFLTALVESDAAAISILDEAEGWLAERATLDADAPLARLCGADYKGYRTIWKGVEPVLDWAGEFLRDGGQFSVDIRKLSGFVAKNGGALDQIRMLAGKVATQTSTLALHNAWSVLASPAAKCGSDGINESCGLAELRQSLAAVAERAGSLAAELNSVGCVPDSPLCAVCTACDEWETACAEISQLGSLIEVTQGVAADIDLPCLRQSIEWYKANLKNGLPAACLPWLAAQGSGGVKPMLSALQDTARWAAAADALSEWTGKASWLSSGGLAEQRDYADRVLDCLSLIDCRLAKHAAPAGPTVETLARMLADMEEVQSFREESKCWSEGSGVDLFTVDTDLLRQTEKWVRSGLEGGADAGLLTWFARGETLTRLRWWQHFVERATRLRSSADRLVKAGLALPEDLGKDRLVQGWAASVAGSHAELAAARDLLQRNAASGATSLQDLSAAAAALAQASALALELERWQAEVGVAPTTLQATQVEAHREWVVRARALSADLAGWMIEGNPTERFAVLCKTAMALDGLCQAREALRTLMQGVGEVQGVGPDRVFEEAANVEALDARFRQLLCVLPQVLPWADYLRERGAASVMGLSALIDAGERVAATSEHLVLAFQAGVAVAQARVEWEADPELAALRGSAHEELRARFADADRSQMQRNRLHVVQDILNCRATSPGVARGSACAATPDMEHRLRHEERKQKRLMPVRALIEAAGPRMQELCPSWLMTPLEVAQFLPPGKLRFDLVVMDEASQLPPEDAWGAIARGNHLVVVGDPRQMPPSDFFESTVAGDEDDESGEEGEVSGAKLDSILDTALGCLPHSWLEWHYRSLHQSLIAAANRFSYDDRLILFPSSYDKHPDLGVRHFFVADATTTTGRVINAKEAEAVVERVLRLALDEARKPAPQRYSVGVAAMNAPQAECIQDLLDSRRANDARIDRALADLEANANEPLFVKNLENIQGDERDIMLISYTYGPHTPAGTPAQRFGPLNTEGGERRFNVMITRAKRRMEVFASIRSEQILIAGKKRGVQDFHYFLKYAESGILPDAGNVSRRGTDSPFEDFVIAVLRSTGYEIEPQVGVAGYFIDIGVRDPQDRGRFALGVECDGATYHSSRAARDRDRLREQVLREREWRLYRIWSTDWFTNHEASKDALLAAVAKVCGAPPKR